MYGGAPIWSWTSSSGSVHVPEDRREEQGTIRPTRVRWLLVAFVIGGGLGYELVPVSRWAGVVPPVVPWTSVVVLVAIAVLVLVLANSTYRTVQRDRRYINPHRAVRYLLLAKASAWVGAVVAGGYLGFASQFVDALDIPLPHDRFVRSLCAAVAALVIVVAGLLLERACRVPDDNDE